jgi:hypothetical protein
MACASESMCPPRKDITRFRGIWIYEQEIEAVHPTKTAPGSTTPDKSVLRISGDMDGPEGEEHVVLGARIMGSLFGPAWEDERLRHSRYWSRRMGLPISRLCLADKMAFALTPAWLYLPMAKWTGELGEYMMRSRQRQAGDNSFTSEEDMLVRSEVPEEWLSGLQSYTLRWVERHRYQYVTRPVAPSAGGRHVPSSETEAVRLR